MIHDISNDRIPNRQQQNIRKPGFDASLAGSRWIGRNAVFRRWFDGQIQPSYGCKIVQTIKPF